MGKNNKLAKVLAVIGTFLVWLPILAPVLFSVLFFARAGFFRIDYLMPAELFLSTLVGAGLLLWAARLADLKWKLIGWGLGAAVLLLIASQGLAVVTGLASGAIEPQGVWWIVVLALLAAFLIADVLIVAGSIILLRQLFGASPQSDSPAAAG